MQNIIYQQPPPKTPQERIQDDVILLSQSTKPKFFNIFNFNTNFLEHRSEKYQEKSNLEISSEILLERECEKSPLFFKISGCVAYCQPLGGCCIFYNNAITEQQMKILYSVPCQQEIFEQASKLFENSIPGFKNIFQYSFSEKLRHKFNLMGLSEDTILLKIKNELPSQRNKFIYNAAMLQMKMLRYDFVISPNLTQYFFKQYLSETSYCSYPQTTNTQNTLVTHTEPQPDNNQLNVEKNKNVDYDSDNYSISGHNNNDNKSGSSDDDDDSDDNSNINEDYEIKNTVQVIHQPLPPIQQPVKYNTSAMRKTEIKLQKKPSSLKSSSASSKTTRTSQDSDQQSSVDIVLPSNKSSTGLTESFQNIKVYHTPASTKSSTGLTEPLKRLKVTRKNPASIRSETGLTEPLQKMRVRNSSISTINEVDLSFTEFVQNTALELLDNTADFLESNDSEYREDNIQRFSNNQYVLPQTQQMNTEAMSRQILDYFVDLSENVEQDLEQRIYNLFIRIKEKSKFDASSFLKFVNDKIVFNPNFLFVLKEADLMDNVQGMFNTFHDLHDQIEEYMKYNNLKRGDETSINRITCELSEDTENRLLQALYLYILSPKITIIKK